MGVNMCMFRRIFSPARKFSFSSFSPVKIVEVGPRDGLQNESKIIPTAVKLKFIRKLRESGLKNIEVASFVSAKWVPQMADSKEIVESLSNEATNSFDVSYPVLIPNMKGFESFYEATQGKLKEVAIFTSASEGFSIKNMNCTITESLQKLKSVAVAARGKNIRVRGYVSSIAKCPYDGKVDPASVVRVAEELLAMGCYEVSLGDTIGAATPGDIERILGSLAKAKIGTNNLAIHCHDTYGQALANILIALQMGIRTVDSSCAGLGGCPFAPGASGNVSTEDLVYMLHGMEIDCGVDMEKLIDAGKFITRELGIPSRSKVASVLSKQ